MIRFKTRLHQCILPPVKTWKIIRSVFGKHIFLKMKSFFFFFLLFPFKNELERLGNWAR